MGYTCTVIHILYGFDLIYFKKFLDIKFVTQVAQFLMKFMHIGIKPTNFQSQGIKKQSLL